MPRKEPAEAGVFQHGLLVEEREVNAEKIPPSDQLKAGRI